MTHCLTGEIALVMDAVVDHGWHRGSDLVEESSTAFRTHLAVARARVSHSHLRCLESVEWQEYTVLSVKGRQVV